MATGADGSSAEADEVPHGVDERGVGSVEHELTLHLERAHELGRRAKLANGAAREEIERARAIADTLRERLSTARRR